MPTPIRASRLRYYLSNYDEQEREFLCQCFESGFCIPFHGPRISGLCRNHVSATSNPSIVNRKIFEEINAGRVQGPFMTPPCEPFICSPIALVPKHEKGSFRLIHNLSFPPHASINFGIDKLDSQVSYDNIDTVISLVSQFGRNAMMAKTDITNAFRLLPIRVRDRCLLGFSWPDENCCLQYFMDCCLPMGLSASCQSFERFSSALQWIRTTKYGARMSHILDDFFFIGPAQSNKCSSDFSRFISICEDIGVPLKQEKTVWPTS